MKNDEPIYFAVPDPDTGDMTYWYRDRRGSINPWPPKVGRYGPRMPSVAGLSREDRDAVVRDFVLSTAKPWRERVMACLEANPDEAAARFAVFQSRCCLCSKALTDAKSKVFGIGPDCREGLPASLLGCMAREMGRIHAQATSADT